MSETQQVDSTAADIRVTRVIVAHKIVACPGCGQPGKQEYEEGHDKCLNCGTKRPEPELLEDPKAGPGLLFKRFFGF